LQKNCTDETNVPGRISYVEKSGFFTDFCNINAFSQSDLRFLVSHKDLRFSSTRRVTNISDIPGIILTKNNQKTYAIGRLRISGYEFVGRVFNSTLSFFDGEKVEISTRFDVLTCTPPAVRG
jgi:hypothetical protein